MENWAESEEARTLCQGSAVLEALRAAVQVHHLQIEDVGLGLLLREKDGKRHAVLPGADVR